MSIKDDFILYPELKMHQYIFKLYVLPISNHICNHCTRFFF